MLGLTVKKERFVQVLYSLTRATLGKIGCGMLEDKTRPTCLAATSGLAHAQLVDTVIWWLSETTSSNQMAMQLAISKIIIGGALADIYAANDATERQAA